MSTIVLFVSCKLDSKLLTQKELTKSSMEGYLQAHNDDKTHSEKGLAATLEYITLLHAKCDWLLKYFEMRKEAKAGERHNVVVFRTLRVEREIIWLRQGSERKRDSG